VGKPSIFSKEYEKKMKKRRRNSIIISLVIVLVASALIIKVICNPIDYKNIKKNIQAWIDSDTTSNTEQIEVKKEEKSTDEEGIKKEVVKEEPQKTLEKSIDIVLISGNVAKAIYIDDNNGGKSFKTLDTTEKGVGFDISPSGKQMIVTDADSTITLYNVDGTIKIISKDKYVSTNGGVFTKEATMQAQPQYLWNVNPKFISDEKIIFVTNRPYFGMSANKQYLWITDIQTGVDSVLWELVGLNIEIGEKQEKGMRITIDGKSYYMDTSGNYVQ
jgi:WD40 repeat protein